MFRRSVFVSLMCLLFMGGVVFGQVNIEAYRKNTFAYSNHLDFSLDAQKGNSFSQTYKLRYRSDIGEDPWRGLLITEWQRSANDQGTFSDDGLVHLRSMLTLSPGFQWEHFVQKQWNKVLLLEDRFLIGTGLRWIIEDRPDRPECAIGLGAMYEDEFYTSVSRIQRIRGTSYVNVTYPFGVSRLSSIIYVQPVLDQWNDFRLLNRNELKIQLSKEFYVTVYAHMDYKSMAVQGINPFECKTGVNLGVSF